MGKKIYQKTKNIILMLLLYCVAFAGVIIFAYVLNTSLDDGTTSYYSTTFNWQQYAPSRTAISSSGHFQEIWHKETVFAGSAYREGSVYLATQDGDLFALVSLVPSQRESLVNLDMLTGEIKWQVTPQALQTKNRAMALFTNSQYLYIAFVGGKVEDDMLFDAGLIEAFDPIVGSKVWSRPIGGARSFTSINVGEKLANVEGDFSSHYYVLNALSGQVVLKERKITEEGGRNGYPLATQADTLFERDACYSIRAVDSKTNQVVWETSLDGCVFQPIMIADRTIIVLQGTRPGNLIAINKETGEVVWRYDEPGIVSNISLGQQRSTAYFLNAEAHLLAVDANTGEILDSIVFIGDDFEEYDNTVDSPLNFVASPFSVVAWENIVVVLLGDSAELFAFRFSPY